jgi:hypothetical protein
VSDIVERLRAYAKNQARWVNIEDTCEEAAAEIERLREALERIAQHHIPGVIPEHWDASNWAVYNYVQICEIARAALPKGESDV